MRWLQHKSRGPPPKCQGDAYYRLTFRSSTIKSSLLFMRVFREVYTLRCQAMIFSIPLKAASCIIDGLPFSFTQISDIIVSSHYDPPSNRRAFVRIYNHLRHPREGGDPELNTLDSRLHGNDGKKYVKPQTR